jgi:predicted branched-subunit amino acid permease
VGQKHWFFLGAGLALWSSWQLSTAAGILLGAVVPASWSLDFTLALTFIALVTPGLKDPAVVGAAFSAGIMAILAYRWPYKLGLVSAALVGILVGLGLETFQRSQPSPVEQDS